ncbi:nucleotide exchange factor GrpE [bacterium]|nr:MAG: nucleotide exchange factor GrpE [bacterium]
MSEEKDIKNNGMEGEDMEKLQKERDEYLDGWKRAKADLINYKKEEVGRLENFAKFSNEVIISDLTSVLDSFELGLSMITENDPARKGVIIIKSQLEDLLRKHGLERIQVKRGSPLDTNLEEAVGEINAAEPPGTIAEEVSSGFKLHGKVIRPARVKISKGQIN